MHACIDRSRPAREDLHDAAHHRADGATRSGMYESLGFDRLDDRVFPDGFVLLTYRAAVVGSGHRRNRCRCAPPRRSPASRRPRTPPARGRRGTAARTAARTALPRRAAPRACPAPRAGRGRSRRSRRPSGSWRAGARSRSWCGPASAARAPPARAVRWSCRASDVASSRIRMRGSFSTTRAIASRCFSPPDSL